MSSISIAVLKNNILDILKKNELSSLTSKKVRRMLEEIHKEDFTNRKQEIDQLLMKLISEHEKAQKSNSSQDEEDKESDDDDEEEMNDDVDDDDDDDQLEDVEMIVIKKKKNKKKDNHDNGLSDSDNISDGKDEEYARKLQEEENDTGRRRTRQKIVPVKKKKEKAKRKPKEGGKTKTNKYMQKCDLSPALAEVMGESQMARSEVVSRVWQMVKEKDLYDPKNRQFMVCDEQMYKVFKRKRIRIFGMMKFLKDHIFDPGELDDVY